MKITTRAEVSQKERHPLKRTSTPLCSRSNALDAYWDKTKTHVPDSGTHVPIAYDWHQKVTNQIIQRRACHYGQPDGKRIAFNPYDAHKSQGGNPGAVDDRSPAM